MAKKEISMRRNLTRVLLIPSAIFFFIVLEATIFTILYTSTKLPVFLVLLISLSAVLFGILLVAVIEIIKYFYQSYYIGIFKTTERNLKTLAKNEGEINLYPEVEVKEFKAMNEELEKVKTTFLNSELIPNEVNYENFNFEYIRPFNNVVTLKTFRPNIENLIYYSRNFKNLFINLYYEMGEEVLSAGDQNRLTVLLKETFKDYKNALIVVDETGKGLYVYFPHIDSLSKVKEQVASMVQNASISMQTSNGLTLVPAKVVGVIYPYSNVDEIMHDLRYARSQNEDVYFYIPNRIFNKEDSVVAKNTVHLNIVSKIIKSVEGLETSKDKYYKILRQSIKDLMNLVNSDEAGLIELDENRNNFYATISLSKSEKILFTEAATVNKEFVNNMFLARDDDNSYYFSDRCHASSFLGRYLDIFSITSGYFYVINDGETPKGVIYFFNKNRDMVIDTYVKEGLSVFSYKVSDFLFNVRKEVTLEKREEDVDNLLKLTDLYTYSINKINYEIKSFSTNFSALYPKIKTGDLCYKVLYGLDKPCQNCPILKGKKMLSELRDTKVETSLNLTHNARDFEANLLVKESGEGENRYDQDLLCYSYYSLINSLNDCYLDSGKGYLLLLRIDNLGELLEKHDPEKLLIAERELIKRIRKANGGVQNIYAFNNQTIALLCKEIGQIDIVKKCEEIYELCKYHYFGYGNRDFFKITYLPLSYPSGYSRAIDFLKNAQKFIESGNYVHDKDSIYFVENNYARSASKKEYMLSVIEDKFSNKTFISNLQPYLLAKDRTVYGVEMLLRLVDDYSGTVFNPDELIKVAADNGKIKLISDALISYTGDLYKSQGASIFKVFGLKRFSINVDYSYFADSANVNSLIELIKSYELPKGFISFEITENEIKQNLEKFALVTPILAREHISLVCDQYTGSALTLEKLKEVGFNEVKVARSLVGFIDSDAQKYAQFADLVSNAKELGMQISTVGVENHEQYDLIRKLDENAFVQGFYFYKPLKKDELINALRNSNAGHKE